MPIPLEGMPLNCSLEDYASQSSAVVVAEGGSQPAGTALSQDFIPGFGYKVDHRGNLYIPPESSLLTPEDQAWEWYDKNEAAKFGDQGKDGDESLGDLPQETSDEPGDLTQMPRSRGDENMRILLFGTTPDQFKQVEAETITLHKAPDPTDLAPSSVVPETTTASTDPTDSWIQETAEQHEEVFHEEVFFDDNPETLVGALEEEAAFAADTLLIMRRLMQTGHNNRHLRLYFWKRDILRALGIGRGNESAMARPFSDAAQDLALPYWVTHLLLDIATAQDVAFPHADDTNGQRQELREGMKIEAQKLPTHSDLSGHARWYALAADRSLILLGALHYLLDEKSLLTTGQRERLSQAITTNPSLPENVASEGAQTIVKIAMWYVNYDPTSLAMLQAVQDLRPDEIQGELERFDNDQFGHGLRRLGRLFSRGMFGYPFPPDSSEAIIPKPKKRRFYPY